MSYSFTVSAANKPALQTLVIKEFDKIASTIPPVYRQQAQMTVATNDGLPPQQAPTGKNFSVTVNGDVTWTGTMENPVITSTSINIELSLVPN